MSLTRFLKKPDVRKKLATLRPKTPRKISKAIMAEPRSKRYMVVGTAFDYLLRFEIRRRSASALWQDAGYLSQPLIPFGPRGKKVPVSCL